ncbi:unnamed protein product [Paramecium sonneborni]|uniref:Transmembrane protein n=1 Tax=Paramecium sonneborni TaxID=65129 RepID=A0A8S1RRQ5_9CILI|nr:unnamed protein product [Paramecium sonneborni]
MNAPILNTSKLNQYYFSIIQTVQYLILFTLLTITFVQLYYLNSFKSLSYGEEIFDVEYYGFKICVQIQLIFQFI